METLQSKTLAMIVKENGKAASVLEKYGLDFCCKGKRTLTQACAEKGLNDVEIASELDSILHSDGLGTYNFPYDKLAPSDLCDYIVSNHHKYVRDELPRILGYAQKVAAKHGERHPNLHKLLSLVEALHAELMPHLNKEEKILFPLIKKLDQAGPDSQVGSEGAFVKQPIQVMEHEHDRAGSLMSEIRQVTDQYQPPAGACTTFRLLYDSLGRFEQDLHQHVHLENNVLFPAFSNS